jgi:hypothetical protein
LIDALFSWNLMIELLMKYCCSFLLLLLLGISGGFAQDKVECWGRYEISLPAKVKGNPFDIELTATFSGPDTTPYLGQIHRKSQKAITIKKSSNIS